MECSGIGTKLYSTLKTFTMEPIYCTAPNAPPSQSQERLVSNGKWEMILKIRILCVMTAKRKSSAVRRLSKNQSKLMMILKQLLNHKNQSRKLMIKYLQFKLKKKRKKLIKSNLPLLLLIDHRRLNIWKWN